MSRLWLEIPIKPEVARFYHFYTTGVVKVYGVEVNTHLAKNLIYQAGYLPRHLEMPFKEQVYIANDEIGLGIFWKVMKICSPNLQINSLNV